jgi:hypothetical protein
MVWVADCRDQQYGRSMLGVPDEAVRGLAGHAAGMVTDAGWYVLTRESS